MKDLQTVLDALMDSQPPHYSDARKTLRSEAIEIVKQMMQAEPVGYVPALGTEMLKEKGGWCRLEGVNSELHNVPLFAAPQAVPAWLPIESAPKDGTPIVVGYGRQSGFPVKVVFFNTVHKFWSHYGEADLGLPSNATHWMPLPAAPKGAM